MIIVLIHVHVLAEHIDAFKQASVANAAASCQERGIARFDVMQQADDPSRFIFVEAYRDAAAQAAHKETAHYALWRDTVEPMMAEQRSRVTFHDVFWTDAV